MSNQAKCYIASIISLGFAVVTVALVQSDFQNLSRFLAYFALTLLASTMKVSLPRITGTISVSFLFILIGIAAFTFTETVLLGCAAASMQSLWRAKKTPKPVQVLFNTACLAIAIGVAFAGSHWINTVMGGRSLAIFLVQAASLFFVTNTGLVAGVVSLSEGKSFRELWANCYAWSFPLYLMGAAIAGLVCMTGQSVGWGWALLLLPLMYLCHVAYRIHVRSAARRQALLERLCENSGASAREAESVLA